MAEHFTLIFDFKKKLLPVGPPLSWVPYVHALMRRERYETLVTVKDISELNPLERTRS